MFNDEFENSDLFLTIDPFTGSGKVTIKGKIDDRMFKLLRKHLEESYQKVNYFALNLEEVEFVDPNSIYLLFAAYQTMAGLKKPLLIDGKCPSAFINAVEKSGFSTFSWLCFGKHNYKQVAS